MREFMEMWCYLLENCWHCLLSKMTSSPMAMTPPLPHIVGHQKEVYASDIPMKHSLRNFPISQALKIFLTPFWSDPKTWEQELYEIYVLHLYLTICIHKSISMPIPMSIYVYITICYISWDCTPHCFILVGCHCL